MADFNQSPAGQAPISLTVSALAISLTDNGVGIDTGFFPSDVFGTSGQFSLASVTKADFDIYPSYRRPIRLISSAPVS